MPKRERATRRTKPATGKKQTPAQKSAGEANLAKGRKAKQEQARAAREAGLPTGGERWAMLLSGQITVKDLDDQEIKRMKVRGQDGTFSGRRRAIPSNLILAFQREQVERANNEVRSMAIGAVKELYKMGTDVDVGEAARVRALTYLADRALGKTPETMRIEGMSGFDKMLSDAIGVDADLDIEASELLAESD